ncbi:MAG: hypothetical protein Q7U56_09360, partial [Humidesulfovibrio sp.]|nr:hypothetical protein [Humidesulfovibrio sp.]
MSVIMGQVLRLSGNTWCMSGSGPGVLAANEMPRTCSVLVRFSSGPVKNFGKTSARRKRCPPAARWQDQRLDTRGGFSYEIHSRAGMAELVDA